MKKIFQTIYLAAAFFLFSTIAFAEEPLWEKDYVQALQKGKAQIPKDAAGLAYTAAESSVLEKAIKKALDMKAPPCEAMKIAVDLDYKAYDVISNIFGYGGDINLNQMCMCATEGGINKQIVAKAAKEAVNSIGEPIFPRDEISQSQCLNDIGLGYHTPLSAPPPIKAPAAPKPFSVASPSGGGNSAS